MPVNIIQIQEYFVRYQVAMVFWWSFRHPATARMDISELWLLWDLYWFVWEQATRTQHLGLLLWSRSKLQVLSKRALGGQFGSRVKVWIPFCSRINIKIPMALECLSLEGLQLLQSDLEGFSRADKCPRDARARFPGPGCPDQHLQGPFLTVDGGI